MQYYICELCSAICYYPKLNNIVTKLVDKIENVIETVTTYSFFNGLIKFKKDVVVEKTSKEKVNFEVSVCDNCYDYKKEKALEDEAWLLNKNNRNIMSQNKNLWQKQADYNDEVIRTLSRSCNFDDAKLIWDKVDQIEDELNNWKN